MYTKNIEKCYGVTRLKTSQKAMAGFGCGRHDFYSGSFLLRNFNFDFIFW
jgi:hypothetical protein